MTRSEHIKEMLIQADKINKIITEMQARKDAWIKQKMPKAA